MFILPCSGGGRASGASPRDEMPDSWRDRASCRRPDVDPDLFFPDGELSRVVRAQVAEAKAVCVTCPVLAQCREYELTPTTLTEDLPNPSYGVFAAMTPDERRASAGRGVAA
jgi:WhiB family redox-sensing transcriptional regulator